MLLHSAGSAAAAENFLTLRHIIKLQL